MESAATESFCALHPDRGAEQTCARCGSFMCGECRAEDLPGHCKACVRRIETGRFVSHVPALGIVMMIHGVLLSGAGLYAFLFGPLFMQSWQARGAGGGSDEAAFSGIMLGVSIVIGVILLVPGIAQFWAGWQVRVYRGRRAGIAALSLGLMSIPFCYCAPSVILLMIWGLVVLFSEDVSARFAASAR